MKKLLLTFGLWLGLTSLALAQAVPVGSILLQQRAQGSGGLSVNDISNYTITQIGSGTFLPLTGGTIGGQLNIIAPAATPVQCPFGAAYVCWQTSDSKAFAFASFDGSGNQTRTWDQTTGRMDLYANSATGQTGGAAMVLAFNNATPANNDILGHYAFRGKDSNNLNFDTYAYLLATSENINASALNSTLQLSVMQNVSAPSGNGQPNVSAILDGGNSLFSLPVGFQFNTSGASIPFAATNTSGPEIVLTNTGTSRSARFGLNDNNTTTINSLGGGGLALEVSNTIGLSVNSAGSITRSPLTFQIGATALATTGAAFGMNKMTASGTAPGAAGGKMELVCGTVGGTAKLVIYAGTATTALPILDSIGGGVTGC